MEIQWPLILFTFFNCLAGGIFLMQGILTLSGKGKAMQLASCISAIVALAIGGLSVFFHLQHPLRMLNGFGHITSGITIELIFVIVFAIAVVLYFLMMRRSEEGVAPKWCAVLAIVVSLALPFATGDSYLMSAIPVWDTMLLPLYYVVATVMLGGLAAILAQVLKEETGAVPDTFLPMGVTLPSPGCLSERLYLFLAKGLHMESQQLDEDEFLNVERIPFNEMVHRVMDGEIEDSKTIAAVLKAKVLLNL